MKAWTLLFRMYEFQPEPAWEAFKREYENELNGWHEECPQEIHEKGLEIGIRSKQKDKSGGTDGWRTAAAHLLPSISCTARQKVMKAVSEGGEWPQPLQYCTIPLLPKSDRSRADEQRPITAFSLWTVGYDKAQYKAAAGWLEKLTPWQMRGARPGGMTFDVAWLVELTLE